MRKSRKSKKCSKGKIRRKGYTTKKGTRVKSTCVPDKGKKGKSKKVLPKPSGKLSLRKHGYSTKKKAKARRASLRKASRQKGEDELKVLRHLNLIRNYQSNEKTKKVMSSDVKWLSKQYKKSKSRKSKNKN